ncbi:hypothetical protein WJ97_11580 [Burkholderia ubonensis]|uniref:hypothetical protein n=1 Tax=Burkholderia ubonensis TaxID=101571 RepID=UPI000759A123|nr:hypothetical protein [Burkholderia ubonensis]KVP96519.1 hypothetical protein WJ97_11580 [Burkholderia ubonensis]
MAMTLGQALMQAEQLEVDGVITKTAQALIKLMQEYRAVVGVDKYEQVIEEAGLTHPLVPH